ncbi:hypothetical protein EKK58_02165 [Candidatus Dependentiae bacterium]|nr:MAG: hypothetical protein EKK58_02165 [Candidatus Dependentiae bacterium]
MNSEKPDGWVAYKEGLRIAFANYPEETTELMTCMTFDSSWRDYESFKAALDKEIARMFSDGWRIRPVKLVFLDTEDGK